MQNRYLLDTCILIDLIRKDANVAKRIIKIGFDNCAISIITYYELFFGAYKAPDKYRDNEILKVRKIVSQFDVIQLPINEDFANYKVGLVSKGEYIGDFDTMIAMTAISNGMVLVTENIKHFNRIDKLKIESWK